MPRLSHSIPIGSAAMHDRRRRGQYFTPPEVVDLAFALLARLEPDAAAGRLLDPSCGEGAFLLGAMRAGFAAGHVYGLDTDPAMIPAWLAEGLLGPAPRLAIGDGLLGAGEGAFDVVAGNPPFAGSMALPPELTMTGRFRWGALTRQGGQAASLPRELWFLERSLNLLRPGGLLALVLPEGVFANRRWEAIRAALMAENQLEALVGLPRRVFRAGRTTVKTCLLIARRQAPRTDHRVLLAELTAEEVVNGPEELLTRWERGKFVAEGRPWEDRPDRL